MLSLNPTKSYLRIVFINIHMNYHRENQNIEIHAILVNNLRNSTWKYATFRRIGFMKEYMNYHGITNTYQHMGIIIENHHIY